MISRQPDQQITSWSTPRGCPSKRRCWRETELVFLSAPHLSSPSTSSGLSSLSRELDLVTTPSTSPSQEVSLMESLGSIRVSIETLREKIFPSPHLNSNQLMPGKLSLVLMNLPSNPRSALLWSDLPRVTLLSLTCQWSRRLSICPHQVRIIPVFRVNILMIEILVKV